MQIKNILGKKTKKTRSKKSKRSLLATIFQSEKFQKTSDFLASKKMLYVLGGFFAFVFVFLLMVFFDLEGKLKTNLMNTGGSASILLLSDMSSVGIGGNFDVSVVVNTDSRNAVAAKAIINYNPQHFELVHWDTSNSIFSVDNGCVYNGAPCEISNHDPVAGALNLTMSKPNPGINTNSGVLAVISFKALAETGSSGSQITVDFQGEGNYEDSDVILNDGMGTDFLKSVSNVFVTAYDPNQDHQDDDQGDNDQDDQQDGQDVIIDDVNVENDDYTFETPTLKTKSSDGGKREDLEKNKRFYSKDGKLSFKGNIEGLGSGKVEIIRNGKVVKSEKINPGQEWKIKYKEKKNGTHEYRMKFYDQNGNEIGETSKYEIKTDKKKPKITDLPVFLNKSRGEMVWWKAEDNHKIDYYRYEFNKKRKNTSKKYFHIPTDTPPGVYSFMLRAYDKAGNKVQKTVLIRVR